MSNEQNQKQKQEKTQVIEEATIEEKNISEQMDEIIKISDKFTLVDSLLHFLCKELEIPNKSQPGAIGQALKTLYENHWKAMENYRNIVKMGKNQDIRQ